MGSLVLHVTKGKEKVTRKTHVVIEEQAGEMAPQGREFAAPPEDRASVPSTHGRRLTTTCDDAASGDPVRSAGHCRYADTHTHK